MATSLRRRFIGFLGAGGLVVWSLLAGWLYWQIRHDINQMFDAHLTEGSRILAGLTSSEALEYLPHLKESELAFDRFVEGELNLHLQGALYPATHAYQISFGDPLKLMRSFGAANLPKPAGETPGFADSRIGGENWRAYTEVVPQSGVGRIVVTVGEPEEVRTAVIRHLLLTLAVPVTSTLALLLWFTWWGITWGLRPLTTLAAEITRRSPGDLQPISTATVPSEISPLAEALNRLLSRLDIALQNERAFTADAAHELRNPLAGIRTQAEVAQRSGQDTERAYALSQIVKGVDRTTHLVEQLLSLARLDSSNASTPPILADVKESVQRAFEDVAPLAKARDVTLLNEVPEHWALWCQIDALDIALRNLLDNAIKHGRSPGIVRVRIRQLSPDEVSLVVEDDGPGVPDPSSPTLGRRFSRLAGTRAPGSGLGLAIVAHIAQMHGGSIRFSKSELGGFGVAMNWSTERAPDRSAPTGRPAH